MSHPHVNLSEDQNDPPLLIELYLSAFIMLLSVVEQTSCWFGQEPAEIHLFESGNVLAFIVLQRKTIRWLFISITSQWDSFTRWSCVVLAMFSTSSRQQILPSTLLVNSNQGLVPAWGFLHHTGFCSTGLTQFSLLDYYRWISWK